MPKKITGLVAIMLFISSSAWAGGFLIYEHGAAATGMADARTAVANDINAIYYNPAAITELPGLQLEIGTTFIVPTIEYKAAGGAPTRQFFGEDVIESQNSTNAEDALFTPVHVYASYNLESLGLSFGYGLNNPFGLGTKWPSDWDGRFVAVEVEIRTFFHQPTIALDIAKLAGFKDSFKLSLGVGYDFVHADATLVKGVDLTLGQRFYPDQISGRPEGTMSMTGTALGHGWNVALYGELPGWLAIGASLRSKVDLTFSGTAKFKWNEDGQTALALLGTQIPDQSGGKLDVELPLNMGFGVAVLAVPNLIIAADFYIAFFESYKELHLQFDCVAAGTCSALDLPPIEKNWGSAMQFSLGAEYTLFDSLALRLGYGMVTSAVPDSTYDPSLPDGRRDLFCLGVGYRWDWLKFDVGYMLAMWGETKDNEVGSGDDLGPENQANGDYTTITHLIAVSAGVGF